MPGRNREASLCLHHLLQTPAAQLIHSHLPTADKKIKNKISFPDSNKNPKKTKKNQNTSALKDFQLNIKVLIICQSTQSFICEHYSWYKRSMWSVHNHWAIQERCQEFITLIMNTRQSLFIHYPYPDLPSRGKGTCLVVCSVSTGFTVDLIKKNFFKKKWNQRDK